MIVDPNTPLWERQIVFRFALDDGETREVIARPFTDSEAQRAENAIDNRNLQLRLLAEVAPGPSMATKVAVTLFNALRAVDVRIEADLEADQFVVQSQFLGHAATHRLRNLAPQQLQTLRNRGWNISGKHRRPRLAVYASIFDEIHVSTDGFEGQAVPSVVKFYVVSSIERLIFA